MTEASKALGFKIQESSQRLAQGVAEHQAGNFQAAAALYDGILAYEPEHPEALHMRGVLAFQQGDHAWAIATLQDAIRFNRADPHYYYDLGTMYLNTGLLQDAAYNFQTAIDLDADHADAHGNLATARKGLGDLDGAVSSYRRALTLRPADAGAYNNLGLTLCELGDTQAGVASLQRAIALRPEYASAHNNMGLAMLRMNRAHEAAGCFLKAIAFDPTDALAYTNLAQALQAQLRTDDAIASFRAALELRPDYAEAHSNLLLALQYVPGVEPVALFAEHQRFATQFESPLVPKWLPAANDKDPERRLKIGYVSGDFRNHAVAMFIEPIFLLHDPMQFEIYCYATHFLHDDVSTRFKTAVHHWRTCHGLTDAQMADHIRADGIDILIDLSGHTAHNRLLTFARKPAPLQLSWMGYPGTTGLASMDYLIADRLFLPPGQFDTQFTEKIICLPTGAPFSPPAAAPDVNALPALATGCLTFGSFNQPAKLSAEVIAVWSQLMRALPSSQLLLGGLPGKDCNQALIALFANEGIERRRLRFHERSDLDSYLALHHQVDICLDTFPYNGSTTTVHALWMGVPTLSMVGRTPAGRAGSAILGHADLCDFVAADAAEFVAKGVHWARSLPELARLRTGLRDKFARSAMGQTEAIAIGLELALRAIWRRWCEGQVPAAFDVPLSEVNRVKDVKHALTATVRKARPIYVTQPLLPPLEEFVPYLEQIWANKLLTNGGPFHCQFEQALCDYLGVKHISLFANGTMALITALQALRITGEVITTPYSFVATAHSLLWNGIRPIFVDIDPTTFNLDPDKIEAAITPETTAIMPVHCYGHPCDVDRIERIADNYGLKVIYDAAHAFGVRTPAGSILNHGDLSILSFHATKVFNTFEGGAIISPNAKTKQHIDHLKNFGFVDETTVIAAGINGKMSEINAAFGLLQLKGIDAALQKRKAIDARYRKGLAPLSGIQCLQEVGEQTINYAYFPILVQPSFGTGRDALYARLKEYGIFARRYFYPLISDFPMYRGLPSSSPVNLPVARKIANEVICLPIYPALSNVDIDFIVGLIRDEAAG